MWLAARSPSVQARIICSQCRLQLKRSYSSSSVVQPSTSPFAPRHLLSIADLTPTELSTLVLNASRHKQAIKSGTPPPHLSTSLKNKTVAITMSKRSTRTRVSSEAAVVALGGHPMFLGKDDIQLGVNETLYDTSVVISSMVSAIFSRVHAHSDVAELAKYSQVPVINSLSSDFHPLQIVADVVTIFEHLSKDASSDTSLGLEGLKIGWVGDSNNVLYDLAIAAGKLGMHVHAATPKGYEIPSRMRNLIQEASEKPSLTESNVPEEAVKDADIIVTDTWISMGQEAEKEQRMKDFKGFQVTHDLIKRGGAKEGWRFMHCLPRKPEEVSDEVFYSPKSLVFPEAENRLWAAISVLEGFVVNRGQISLAPTTKWQADI